MRLMRRDILDTRSDGLTAGRDFVQNEKSHAE
jgi:hypothetical protein